MDNSMNRRLLKAKHSGRNSINDTAKSKKELYDAIASPQSSFQRKSQFNKSNAASSSCSSHSSPSSKFSANDRLKKYRTSLENRRNEFIKVHQVFKEEVSKSDESKNFGGNFDRESKTLPTPTLKNDNHQNASFSLDQKSSVLYTPTSKRDAYENYSSNSSTSISKRDEYKNTSINFDRKSRILSTPAPKGNRSKSAGAISNRKSNILLGKRKGNDQMEKSNVNELDGKRRKTNNNNQSITSVKIDKIKNIIENINENKTNPEQQNILHNKAIIGELPSGYEDDCDMDWSPIDQNDVVSNIQRFRDTHKENSFERQDMSPFSVGTSTITSCNNKRERKTLYVVVDTNIFISHLSIVRDMLSKEYDILGHIVYVPWIVMQELDYFKDGRSGSPAMLKSARKAVKFINDNLIQPHTRLKGQTVTEALYEKQTSSNPDDGILFSCIQVGQTSNTVILLSNDVNLRNKALINNIASYGPKDILIKIKVLSINDENKQKLQQINFILSNMCTEIILIEMQDAYGSILYKLISEPPWDLKQCLIYIKRFWTPVFSLTISQKQCLKAIEDLLTLIQTCHDITTEGNTDEFIKLCLSMCVYFKNCLKKHQRSVESSINDIQRILS